MDHPSIVNDRLVHQSNDCSDDNQFLQLEWRRTNIESYLLCPKAIALASNKSVEEVKCYFQHKQNLSIDDDGCIGSDAPDPIIRLDGKNIFTKENEGLEKVFFCNKFDVARNMTADEVCEDIKIFFSHVNNLFATKIV